MKPDRTIIPIQKMYSDKNLFANSNKSHCHLTTFVILFLTKVVSVGRMAGIKNNTKKMSMKRGCEITASTEKEDFSFKMNERSSFMLKLTCDENFNYKL